MIGGFQMFAVKMEKVGDRAVDGNEALALSRRLEPHHTSFPLAPILVDIPVFIIAKEGNVSA